MVALKTGRREVPGLNPGRACRPSRSEFSELRNSRKHGLGSLRKTPMEDTPPIGLGPTSGQLALNLQLNPTLNIVTYYCASNNNFKIKYLLKTIQMVYFQKFPATAVNLPEFFCLTTVAF